MDVCWQQEAKKERIVPDANGEYWRCTAIEPNARLRVGRGIGQTETQAAIELWQQVKQRNAHRDNPPPVLSDGWGGHREALVEVYGYLPPYKGRGPYPKRKKPKARWHYTQMVKQRDATGNLIYSSRGSTLWGYDEDSGQDIYWGHFSALMRPGQYRVIV